MEEIFEKMKSNFVKDIPQYPREVSATQSPISPSLKKKGIHIIVSKDVNLIRRIKLENRNLWEYQNEKYYLYFEIDEIKNLEKELVSVIKTLKEREISEPSEFNKRFMIIQKIEK